jgi:hypothetical protein
MIDLPLQCCIMERLDISGNSTPSAQRRMQRTRSCRRKYSRRQSRYVSLAASLMRTSRGIVVENKKRNWGSGGAQAVGGCVKH